MVVALVVLVVASLVVLPVRLFANYGLGSAGCSGGRRHLALTTSQRKKVQERQGEMGVIYVTPTSAASGYFGYASVPVDTTIE